MSRRPIDARVESTVEEDRAGDPGVPPRTFKEALSYWASGVSVVAARDPDDGKVHATTVSSFGGVSVEPPRVVVSLGAPAQVLPFLEKGHRFTVNLLSEPQRRLARLFTDPFPVGPTPFPDEGDPILPGSLASLLCQVEEVVPVGGSRLIVGLVTETGIDADDHPGPLLYYRKRFRTLADGEEEG